MSIKLLHIPKARDIVTLAAWSNCPFETRGMAELFLKENSIFYLSEQDAYIAYRNEALAEIGTIANEFISNTGGYHVQPCEIELVEV